jgi:hypothetical protein
MSINIKNSKIKGLSLLVSFTLICLIAFNCQNKSVLTGEQLEAGFLAPPDEAKPRVWWHWMNGNITKEGIRADLEWMNRVGIGGFQNFDAGLSTPQVVEERLIFMTPGWKDAFKFATDLADSLNLEMAIAGSPGWSQSGGPWVKPEEAMKKFVWSETRIDGGTPFSGTLSHPPTTTGSFQNIGSNRGGMGMSGGNQKPIPEYYADIAVIAARLPDGTSSMLELNPKVTSSGGTFSLDELTDGDLVKSSLLPSAPAGKSSWIQFEYPAPQTIQSITIASSGGGGGFGSGSSSSNAILEVSDDGKNFIKVIDVSSGNYERTLSFAPVTGKFFRYSVKTPESQPQQSSSMFGMFGGAPAQSSGTPIAELVLYSDARVNRFEEKAAFSTATNLYAAATPEVTNAIAKTDVMDITSNMASDGTLTWTPPEGKWIVLRFGFTLTGHQNSPASPEATGLEVDKLNPEYVRNYFTNYLDQYKDATGGLMGARGLQFVITDSWEAGTQNWTDNMMAEFNARRGYDMTTWFPALVGYVVENSDASDKFLWDFRRTLEELVAEYHYDQLTDLLNERGMGRYSESHEGGRACIADGMEIKRRAAVPMSATWTPGGFGGNQSGVATRFKADVRESASVSHIYGQKYVAAESLTAMGTDWAWSPELLKPVADMELASGLNRFVIHTSVHQPLHDKIPGLSLGPFGQWFTRHETWAEQAIAWTTYLGRSSFMLQQGRTVADIAYFYGHDNNITALFGQNLPNIPTGYEFDFVNPDALLNVLSFQNGSIETPSGMKYKLLVLDQNCSWITLPVLKKIYEMVEKGAIVLGDKPLGTPSLSDNKGEFNTLVNELWPDAKGKKDTGKGSVYAGYSIKEVLDMISVAPDFSYEKPREDTELLYVHRNLGDIDFFWVNNRNNRKEDLRATFRVTGREAEIWHPETGLIEPASYSIKNNSTEVQLNLEPNDAIFVVFRNKAKEENRTIDKAPEQVLAEITGPWNITFQAGRGAPAKATFESLTPWNENSDKGIKFFSGTAVYKNSVDIQDNWLTEGTKLWIDLGHVQNLAEIVVNGKSAGIVWKVPFKTDITQLLKEGENSIEIKVTNLWVNRLIGDRQPDATEQITYTTQRPYNANSPLLPSGLMGPVRIVGRSK